MTEPVSNDQIFISKLTEIIQANLQNESFGVKDLALKSGLSLYTIKRKLFVFKKITISQFIREVRLMMAMELLKNGTFTAAEVSFKVGFGSPAYFNKCFHECFGYPPGKVIRIESLANDNKDDVTKFPDGRQAGNSFRKYLLPFPGILTLAFLLVLGILVLKKIKSTSDLKDYKTTLAVLPFQNRTNDTIWNVWEEGIQECLISWLSNSEELKVIRKETIYTLLKTQSISEYASGTIANTGKLLDKLDASMVIYGNLIEGGTSIILNTEIISTKTKEVLKSFEISATAREIDFEIIDSLRKLVTDYLLVSKLISENPWLGHFPRVSTNSPEALKCYIYGSRAYYKADWETAKNWFLKAISADSAYVDALSRLYSVNKNLGKMEEAIHWLLDLYKKSDQMPYFKQLYTKWLFSELFEAPDARIKYLRQLQEIDDQGNYYYLIGAMYVKAKQFDKAVPEDEKYLEISRKKGKEYLKDNWVYPALGEMYHLTGQYKKEKRLYREAERVNPDHSSIYFSWIIRDQGSLALTEGDTIAANEYIKKFISVRKGNSSSEADISEGLGDMYWLAAKWDKGEEYYRKALSLEPDNPQRMNTLANRLIDREQNLDEVTQLMDKAMEIASNKFDYYNYSDTKGYGLYKQGKYQEALDILQRTWDEAPYRLFIIKSHLEEVKKAMQFL